MPARYVHARAALPDVLDRVLAGEEVTITRHGQPVAVVVRPDAIRARRADHSLADAERLSEILTRVGTEPLSNSPALTARRAKELVAAVDSARRDR